MKIEIKHRWNGSTLFAGEFGSMMLCVEAAIDSRANLARANLAGADLARANLARANLAGADLARANLARADLARANLARADLAYANLARANLAGADLARADLARADLAYANLARADLARANLAGANLAGADLARANLARADLAYANLARANLAGAEGISPELSTDLLMLLDQPGKIRAYKLVTSDGVGPFNGGVKYEIGSTVQAEANTDPTTECGAGINVATLPWCLRNWQPGYRVLLVEFEAADIAAIPHGTDGKFRLRRCAVVGEKQIDFVALGLVKVEKQESKP